MAVGPIFAEPVQPTRIQCLQCQLIGHRRLTCSMADDCKKLPHNFFLGPLLLAGWVATAIAFFLAVR